VRWDEAQWSDPSQLQRKTSQSAIQQSLYAQQEYRKLGRTAPDTTLPQHDIQLYFMLHLP